MFWQKGRILVHPKLYHCIVDERLSGGLRVDAKKDGRQMEFIERVLGNVSNAQRLLRMEFEFEYLLHIYDSIRYKLGHIMGE